MSDEIRYVMILEIQKIIKKAPKADYSPRNSTTVMASEDLRTKHDVAKIVISDRDLVRLIERGGKHLELVQDEGMEIK